MPTMSKRAASNPLWIRCQEIMDSLGIKTQTEFAKIAGTTRAVVNQWKAGHIKTMHPRYARAIEKRTDYSAEWLVFGELPKKIDRELEAIKQLWRGMTPAQRRQFRAICETFWDEGNDKS